VLAGVICTVLSLGVAAETVEVIAGTDGPDMLTGTLGDDFINGRDDADVMTGLAGNDIYVVDDYDDQVVEQADEGIDTVRVSASYAMPAYVENLFFVGGPNKRCWGNDLQNRMVGNEVSNTLDGGRGNDILTGRGGTDEFRFTTPLDASTNVDRIRDFDVEEDTIGLSYRAFPVFTNVVDPWLWPDQVVVGPSATRSGFQFVYNPETGTLSYDHDGTGPKPAKEFAKLPPNLALTSQNFRIYYRYLI
jgi:Ca2+-binding RTX toxin-like protein